MNWLAVANYFAAQSRFCAARTWTAVDSATVQNMSLLSDLYACIANALRAGLGEPSVMPEQPKESTDVTINP